MFGSTTAFCRVTSALFLALMLLSPATPPVRAQAYERDLSLSAKSLLTIKNRAGRVSVVASENEKEKSTLKAVSSTGAPVEPGDVIVSGNAITVRERSYRIDLTVHVPKRARVRIESEAGMIDVIGDFESADVITNTGTIHADVPTDALKVKFQWESSRPRFLSDIELPRVKEGHAGSFSISGLIGPDARRKKEKKKKADDEKTNAEKGAADGGSDKATDPAENATDDSEKPPEPQKLVQLNFVTERGVILLNVDPSMAPNDLRERPLTQAAKAIVRSGDGPLADAIRKVSPRMFGEYARSLPPPQREPALVASPGPGEMVTAI